MPRRRIATASNVVRDPHRHPLETSRSSAVRARQHGGGDPAGQRRLLHGAARTLPQAEGPLHRRNRDELAAPQYLEDHQKLLARLKAEPALYGNVVVTKFNAGLHEVAPPGSADFVLTFRNLHNWVERGEAAAALRAFHRALKPGGVLGVVDHRGRTDLTQEAQMKSGYVREDYAVALIEAAGFRLAGRSAVNDNAKDTKDHPAGVWTLPPTYRPKDQDRAKYAAIGESDRFTLRFVKP